MYNGSSENTGDTGGANLLAGGPPAGMPPMGDFPPMPAGGPPAGMPPMGELPDGFPMPDISGTNAKNLSISFQNVQYSGCISASISRHRVEKITKENCEELGEVTNQACEAVNNGVIVSLDADSEWNVTDVCYLTALDIEEGAVVRAARMTVDGTERTIKPGCYQGKIVLYAE